MQGWGEWGTGQRYPKPTAPPPTCPPPTRTQPQVAALRKGVQEVGKAYANRAAKAATKRDAAAAAEEGAEMLQKVVGRGAGRRRGVLAQ